MAAKVNHNFSMLSESYLFSEVARRVAAFEKAHPEREIIRMGIGDVTRPLPPVMVEAMVHASEEMGDSATFRGYGPEQGYPFLREAVRGYYRRSGVELDVDEIFISDGAKSDLGNIGDIFDPACSVLVTDPVYPVYLDTSIMSGRKVSYAAATRENHFRPAPPDPERDADGNPVYPDLIFLCSPNNPTGAAMNRKELSDWVCYAKEHGSVILFDAAYECFIDETETEGGGIPHSIYEIPGAKSCAIEFCSLSKKAGFTGLRCGYTVIPKELRLDGISLRDLWFRRQSTRFNGASYITQRAAEAVFTEEGEKAVQENLRYYRENAAILAGMLDDCGIYYTGGKHSPYIWMECRPPVKMAASGSQENLPCTSWDFFDRLLQEVGVVGTPGSGFGTAGEGYIRLTAFSTREKTETAAERLLKYFR